MTVTVIGHDSGRITSPNQGPSADDPHYLPVAIGTMVAAIKARSIADIEWAGAYGGYLDGRIAALVETGWASSAEAVHDAINTVLDSYIGERPEDELLLLGRALADQLGWVNRA